MEERKLKKMQITGEVLCKMFKRKSIHEIGVLPNGLPDDAKVVGAVYDIASGFIELTIESAEFDPTPENEEPETMGPPTFVTTSFSRTLSEIAEGMVRSQTGEMIVLQREDMRKMAAVAVGTVLKTIGVLQ